jgi:DNA-binding MarR family transcriptional regulator
MTARLDDEHASTLRQVVLRMARALRSASADEGLTPAQSGALAALVRLGPTRAGDLAAVERLNPTMLSRVVAHLEGQQLLERRADPNDRRGQVLSVSPQGEALIERLRARRTQLLSEHVDRLPEADAQALVAALPALARLADSLSDGTFAPLAQHLEDAAAPGGGR